MIKKIILSAAALMLTAGTAYAMTPGDVIGTVYTTDIVTKLDGVPIPSYNIDGYTVIAIKDLRSYGFTVNFNEETRRADVITGDKPGDDNVYPDVPKSKYGSIYGNVLYTDIVAYVNGVKIPSYNVDGYTCVMVEELGELKDDYNKEVGWSDYNFRHYFDADSLTLNLYAFRFENTFVDAINASKLVASNNELELYTKGDTAPYYNAKFEPEKGVYAGITADTSGDFSNTFGVYSSYFEFDSRQSDFAPQNKAPLEGKDNINLIPWNTSDVTQVWDNDEYIRKTLDNISATGKKSIIRFAGEMNIGDLGNSPTAYVKAFRHVADIVHEYDNLAIMWSPNDIGSFNKTYKLYYPGDKYVDWIGISSFVKPHFMSNVNSTDEENLVYSCGDYSWTTVALKRITSFMAENNIEKPVAISEGGAVSTVTYAELPNLHEWAYPRLRAMYWYTAMKFPQVKIVTYFNQNSGGEDCGYKTTSDYREIINECIKDAGYLTTASDKPDFTFVKADSIVYKDLIPLYTYVYIPHENIKSVEYTVDGKTLAASDKIPFNAELKASDIGDSTSLTVKVTTDKGTHTAVYSISHSSDGYTLKEAQPLS